MKRYCRLNAPFTSGLIQDFIEMEKLLVTIKKIKDLLRRPVKYLLWLLVGITLLWCCGIIYYLFPLPKWINIIIAILFIIWSSYSIFGKKATKGKFYGLLGIMLVICYYNDIHPSNDRNWEPSFSRCGYVEFYDDDPNLITVHNIRDFKYRSVDDFDVKYKKESYKLNELETMDFIVVHWDNNEAIAHTMLSYGFKDGRYLTFSMETRLDSEDTQGAIPGLFKQFELICIVGTEQDLLGLRTNHRKEEVFLYRTNLTPSEVQNSFYNMITYLNYLNQNADFYNTLTKNCTTSLSPASTVNNQHLECGEGFQVLLNGYSDLLAYNRNKLSIAPGESFKELKRRSYINPRVEFKTIDENYSKLIRQP